MIIVIIAYMIILYVYSLCPLFIQLAGFVINVMVPDPIPFLDEFIMILCMLGKLEKLERILDFKDDHPILFWIICISVIVIIVSVIVYIYHKIG